MSDVLTAAEKKVILLMRELTSEHDEIKIQLKSYKPRVYSVLSTTKVREDFPAAML